MIKAEIELVCDECGEVMTGEDVFTFNPETGTQSRYYSCTGNDHDEGRTRIAISLTFKKVES